MRQKTDCWTNGLLRGWPHWRKKHLAPAAQPGKKRPDAPGGLNLTGYEDITPSNTDTP